MTTRSPYSFVPDEPVSKFDWTTPSSWKLGGSSPAFNGSNGTGLAASNVGRDYFGLSMDNVGYDSPGMRYDSPIMGGGYGSMSGWGGGVAKAGAAGSGSMMDSFFRQKNAEGMTSGGYGELGLGLLSGGVNTYLGFKQYQMAKQGLQQQQKQFDMNYAAARQTTNTAMEDRQKARVASNGSAYESVDSYMNRNRVA